MINKQIHRPKIMSDAFSKNMETYNGAYENCELCNKKLNEYEKYDLNGICKQCTVKEEKEALIRLQTNNYLEKYREK